MFKQWNGNSFHLALAGIENQTMPDNRYERIVFSEEEKKEGIDMCRVLDYREARGEARGIQIGIEQGIEQGIERERLKGICNLMKNLSFSTEQAMEALEIPVKDREKYHLMLQ